MPQELSQVFKRKSRLLVGCLPTPWTGGLPSTTPAGSAQQAWTGLSRKARSAQRAILWDPSGRGAVRRIRIPHSPRGAAYCDICVSCMRSLCLVLVSVFCAVRSNREQCMVPRIILANDSNPCKLKLFRCEVTLHYPFSLLVKLLTPNARTGVRKSRDHILEL